MKRRKKSEVQKFRVKEQLCFLILSDYHRCLIEWRERFAPATADEEWDSRFVESCQQMDSVEYVLDLLLSETEEKRNVIVDELFQSGMIERLQERMKQKDKEETDGK